MKIATNAPFCFTAKENDQLLPLGDSVDTVEYVVLMLEKNWGTKGLQKIKNTIYWLDQYPQETPCVIVGCETVIPGENFKKYANKERDEAVRLLCDKVLTRSKSIGVRGRITYLYLTKFLGYRAHQVDIISDLAKLSSFLKKNEIPLDRYRGEMFAFQKNPHLFYEKSPTFEKDITIGYPRVLHKDDSSVRLCADISIDGAIKELWCETSNEYEQYLLVERCDAFLSVILPLAMRSGKNIICKAPVTEQLLHNLREVLIPNLCSEDSRLFPTQITAVADASALSNGNAVATGMSCGVDSLYTTKLYTDSPYTSMNLTHLYTGNYLYGNKSIVYQRTDLVANDLQLKTVKTKTNINEELGLPHLPTHFFKTLFGVLALRKLFKTYYYSSAGNFSTFNLKDNATKDTVNVELLLLYTFSCPDFQLLTGGGKSTRKEKTKELLAFPPAQKYLNVCLHPEKAINCGKCGKCLRTLFTIDMFDALDLFSSVFDIPEYRKTRLDSFVFLVKHRSDPFLVEIYEHFKTAESELIQQAEKQLSASSVRLFK